MNLHDSGIKAHESISDLLSDLTENERALLERRARELSHAAVDDSAAQKDLLQILTFQLEDEIFGVRSDQVSIVRPLNNRTRVPNAPDFVVGVTNLRGDIISLIDLRRFFGLPGLETTDIAYFLVVNAAGLEIGLVANEIGEVLLISHKDFAPSPITVKGVESNYIEGVSPEGIILLNLNAILGDPRMVVDN